MLRIGLPQCLLWYDYYPLWKTFWQELGAVPVCSGPTDRAMLESGLEAALDELCLPMKLAHGHVQRLAQLKVDHIFLPRLVSVEPRCFTCPNIMGLPDMIRSRMRHIPPLLSPRIDLRRGAAHLEPVLKEMAALAGRRPSAVPKAWAAALSEQGSFSRLLREGYSPAEAIAVGEGKAVALPPPGDLTVGLVGHGYVVYDAWLSLNLISALRGLGCRVVGMEALSRTAVEAQAAGLPRRVFWSSGKKMTGAALVMESDPDIDGVVFMSSMGCGPDSILLNTVAKSLKATPGLFLSVDEHSAETAVMTRLEAFCDMLRRKRRAEHEPDVSPHGQPAYGGADPDEGAAARPYRAAADYG
ncbi:MAG: acyl-CoA dehydratase activase-related protein [Syntrophomonadaceae bacterium]|nr:acyl-CoA dehydratase activase-related protein [Syntrophomonadaceae bacterium]